MTEKITKSDSQWREELTPEQYAVLRQHATERPFTGALLNNKELGVYTCAACGQALFASESKFNSMTGWPSFWDVIDAGNVQLLAQRIGWLTEHPREIERMGENAFQALERFSAIKHWETLKTIYDETIDTKKS